MQRATSTSTRSEHKQQPLTINRPLMASIVFRLFSAQRRSSWSLQNFLHHSKSPGSSNGIFLLRSSLKATHSSLNARLLNSVSCSDSSLNSTDCCDASSVSSNPSLPIFLHHRSSQSEARYPKSQAAEVYIMLKALLEDGPKILQWIFSSTINANTQILAPIVYLCQDSSPSSPMHPSANCLDSSVQA